MNDDLQVGDIVYIKCAGDRIKDAFSEDMDRFIGTESRVVSLKYPYGSWPNLVELENTYWFARSTLELVQRKDEVMSFDKEKRKVADRNYIVGSISEDTGRFSIAASPRAHYTESEAKTEAKRLASEDSTKMYVVMQLRAGFKVPAAKLEEI